MRGRAIAARYVQAPLSRELVSHPTIDCLLFHSIYNCDSKLPDQNNHPSMSAQTQLTFTAAEEIPGTVSLFATATQGNTSRTVTHYVPSSPGRTIIAALFAKSKANEGSTGGSLSCKELKGLGLDPKLLLELDGAFGSQFGLIKTACTRTGAVEYSVGLYTPDETS